MENIKAKYIIYNSPNQLEIIQEGEHPEIYPLHEEVFENASIIFNDNQSITLEGDVWDFGFLCESHSPSDLKYEVHPKYIKKRCFTKKDVIRPGWHRKLHNQHQKIIIKNYIIKFPKQNL